MSASPCDLDPLSLLLHCDNILLIYIGRSICTTLHRLLDLHRHENRLAHRAECATSGEIQKEAANRETRQNKLFGKHGVMTCLPFTCIYDVLLMQCHLIIWEDYIT